jgi:transcriptional regulator with XRE-family HTH domain
MSRNDSQHLLRKGELHNDGMEQRHERLRQARILAGYETASDAARVMGLGVSTYSGHEDGNRGIRPDNGERYAQFFRVSYEWLMTGKGAPRKTNGANTLDARVALLTAEEQQLVNDYVAFIESRRAVRRAG